jgi:hypothetical protein
MKCLICNRESTHASGMCSEKCWKEEEQKQLLAQGYFVPPLNNVKVIRPGHKDRTEPEKIALAQSLIEFMNELVKIDKNAIHALIETRVICNKELVGHPTVQVSLPENSEIASVGLLGILNGFVGVDNEQWGYMTSIYDDDGRLIGFDLRDKFKVKPE